MKTEFAPLFQLDRAEKLQLVEDLWDSIAAEKFKDVAPAWKRGELHRRKERLLKNPSSGRTWDEVKRHARKINGQPVIV